MCHVSLLGGAVTAVTESAPWTVRSLLTGVGCPRGLYEAGTCTPASGPALPRGRWTRAATPCHCALGQLAGWGRPCPALESGVVLEPPLSPQRGRGPGSTLSCPSLEPRLVTGSSFTLGIPEAELRDVGNPPFLFRHPHSQRPASHSSPHPSSPGLTSQGRTPQGPRLLCHPSLSPLGGGTGK